MTRKLAMLATAAAIVAVPQIAQAGCNGPACSGFSSTANYSASDKRVRATVTNRETNPIHLKFCVNVDYHCNGFDVTIPPHETITKDVAFSGAKPPKIAAVDVVTAEFAGAHPATAGGTAGVASVAVLAMDTPRGKVTYVAAKQAIVTPLLTKAVELFRTADSSFHEAKAHAEKLVTLSEKLGSMKDAGNQVYEVTNKDDGKVRDEAHIAQHAQLGLSHFNTTLKMAETNAANAATNLAISQDDLLMAKDIQYARDFRARAEKIRGDFNLLFKAIGTGADVAVIALSDPGSKVNAALSIAQKMIDLFEGDYSLFAEAEKLEAEAVKIGVGNAEKKLHSANIYLQQLKQVLTDLKARLPEYKTLVERDWSTAEKNYDKAAKANKKDFNFDNLQQAIDEAQRTIDLVRTSTEAAYGAREALRKVGEAAGEYTADGGGRIVAVMIDDSSTAFNWGIKARPSAELLLKKFNAMYAMAHGSMQ